MKDLKLFDQKPVLIHKRDVQVINDNIIIKNEETQYMLNVNDDKLIKQEPFEHGCVETWSNVYDSLLEVVKHELFDDNTELEHSNDRITSKHIAETRPLSSALAKALDTGLKEEGSSAVVVNTDPSLRAAQTVARTANAASVHPCTILRDWKLLDTTHCLVLLTRIPCLEERARTLLNCISVQELGALHHSRECQEWCASLATDLAQSAEQNITSGKRRQAVDKADGSCDTNDNQHIDSPFNDGADRNNDAPKESKKTESQSKNSLTWMHTISHKKLNCAFCEYKCNYNSVLVRHMRTHSGEKPFSCDICQSKFCNKGQLLQHIRSHTGQKPFSCNLCHYKTARRNRLVIHMRTHTGEKPFACACCEYKSNDKGILAKHMRTHTKDKPYTCTLCKYKCARKSNLVRHMTTHTGEKPITCNFCAYRCARKHQLVLHMRTHTRGKTVLM